MLWTVSRATLAKLQAFKKRMGWTFPWASSQGGDFNFDFNVSFTEEQQRTGTIEYNYERGGHAMDVTRRRSRSLSSRHRSEPTHRHTRATGRV